MTHPILEAILARRSSKAHLMVQPVPTGEALERIFLAASRAPDHGRMGPFRFIIIADAARARLADVVAQATGQASPGIDDSEIERAREKALEGPMLIAMVARIQPQHVKIPASDQWLTAGCALQNFLLAAQAEGFAVAMRSGRYLEMDAVRDAFSLGESEQLVCLCAIGTATDWPPSRPKPGPETLVSTWEG